MIYYSHRTRKALLEGHTFLPLGVAHYSYGSVCQKFISAFAEMDVAACELAMPEIYADARHAPFGSPDQPATHIAFKPFDEIRVLKGARNIAHVAWEFDRLPTLNSLPRRDKRRDNPTNDYVRMLELASEVWVGSSYTKARLMEHGLGDVHVVPAPIQTSHARISTYDQMAVQRSIGAFALTRDTVSDILEGTRAPLLRQSIAFRVEHAKLSASRVFLSIFNPGDARKNAASLLYGFQDFIGRTRRNDILILKLVTDGAPESTQNAFSSLFPRHFEYSGIPFSFIDCPNIVVLPQYLSKTEMTALYALADFYVCTSGAEGQGLPVQEAMAAGVPPISSRETAMADYVGDTNAIVMETTEHPIPMQIAEAYALPDLRWRLPDHKEVTAAFVRASELSDDDYSKMSAAAKATIEDNYSNSAVIRKVKDRLELQ